MRQTASTISLSPRSNANGINNWHCYRTYSHSGFRISTAQSMAMHHFHLPARRLHGIPFISFRSPSQCCTQLNNQIPFDDESIPEIKCSLCSKHRICKRKLEMYSASSTESLSRFNSTNRSELLSSIQESDTDEETLQSPKKKCLINNARKIIVTILTKDACSVEVETFSRSWYTHGCRSYLVLLLMFLFILSIGFLLFCCGWESSLHNDECARRWRQIF